MKPAAAPPALPPEDKTESTRTLLSCYQAIERASNEMLAAAQAGDWERLMHLEGACAVLISQLKHAARHQPPLPPSQSREKHRIMLRILANDAQVRKLAEPWLEDLDLLLSGTPFLVH